MNDIIIAVISFLASFFSGLLTLIGVIITNTRTNRDIERKISVSQAVTDTKLAELTREGREHTRFAMRMPVVEEQIKSHGHRISDLENLSN